MQFVYYSSLKSGAKKALEKAPFKGRKYATDKVGGQLYIAALDRDGRALDWVLVLNGGRQIK